MMNGSIIIMWASQTEGSNSANSKVPSLHTNCWEAEVQALPEEKQREKQNTTSTTECCSQITSSVEKESTVAERKSLCLNSFPLKLYLN